MRRALSLCALLAACGGRTISDDYRDAGAAIDRAPPPMDTPASDAPEDVPIRRDVPVSVDAPAPCGAGQTACLGVCVDLQRDPRNCGACGLGCGPIGFCEAGRCQGQRCPDGLALCRTGCFDLRNDPRNCGACDRACSNNRACIQGVCAPMTTPPPFGGPVFRVEALSGVDCQVAEHAEVTGDDRGGIAAMGAELLYTGDSNTGVFPLDALAMGRPAQVGSITWRFDGLVSDLRTGLAYTLALQGAPFDLDDVPEGDGTVRFDALLGIGPGGVLGAARIPLSRTISVSLRGNNVGVYAGWGRMVIHDDAVMHHISLPEGVVTTVPFTSILPRARCESWANWGLAEYADDTLSLVYVEAGRRIARYNTRTGAITTVATFDGLSDMCSIVALPRRARWAFHFEGGSQFGAGDELIGHCQGRFRFDN